MMDGEYIVDDFFADLYEIAEELQKIAQQSKDD
jgi:hypothetical protein